MLVSCSARPRWIGHLVGRRAGVAEGAHRQPPDRGGHPVAIEVELGEVGRDDRRRHPSPCRRSPPRNPPGAGRTPRTARRSTRVTGSVGLAAVQAGDPAAPFLQPRPAGLQRRRVVGDVVDRCGRRRRWRTWRAAAPAAAPPCRGRKLVPAARTTASTASRSACAGIERRSSRQRTAARRAALASTSGLVSLTRVASGSPRPQPRGQAARPGRR